MQLNINTDAVVKFTNTLEKLHKSALPSAIRGTLNKAVYDVKTNTMLKSAGQTFIKREPNFFRANSKFENAIGFNVNQMKATVGFLETGLRGENNYAVKDLEEQEYGGKIDGRSFIPMKAARFGGKGRVRPNARLEQIKNKIPNAVNTKSVGKRFLKQKFIRTAIKAKELNYTNAFMLGNLKNGSQTLFRVDELHTATRSQGSFGSRKLHIKLTAIYRVKKNRLFKVKQTSFMRKASVTSANKLNEYYIAEATRQFEKFIK